MLTVRNSKKDSSEETIRMLLSHQQIDDNLQNNNKCTALILAAIYSKTDSSDETVRMLLNHPQINVNLKTNDGWTALMIAARNSKTDSSDDNFTPNNPELHDDCIICYDKLSNINNLVKCPVCYNHFTY